MWPTSHLHAPRRSHEQNFYDPKSSRSSSPDGSIDDSRKTSSDATPRQTPATTRFLNDHTNTEKPEGFASTKRLGFFADKLTSSLSGTPKDNSANSSKISLHPSQLLHPHSHARAESNSAAIPSLASTTIASTSNMTSTNKSHTSPSKAGYGRTYDSKVISKEMHRLGNLSHLPSALAPQISTSPSVASLALPATTTLTQTSITSTSITDPWNSLHVYVLPLFNGEPLRVPIEQLNSLVSQHIRTVVSSVPSKALSTLENDVSELIASGMVTLNAKLTGVDDDKLVGRVVEIWGFFWDQVLTYLEGVLLPLHTEPMLLNLYRPSKTHRGSSPTRQNGMKATSTLSSTAPTSIDVRSLALRSFRDKVILPPFQRLYSRLSTMTRSEGLQDSNSYQQPRLQQMLLVLSSQSRRNPPAFSLTTPTPQPTAGEAAIRDLLRLVRTPRPQNDKFKHSPAFQSRTPTFLSTGLPRDRRGRIAPKDKSPLAYHGSNVENDEDILGSDIPRIGPVGYLDMEREQNQELLESLRSPDIEPPASRMSLGGWGLGAGHEEGGSGEEGEEEEDPPNLEQIQADVERMVGMNPSPEMRRRPT